MGNTAYDCYQHQQDTRLQVLKTPFKLESLQNIAEIDLAIISEITDTLDKSHAMQWLGLIRNYYAKHIIVIAEKDPASQQGWQLADYLAMGMKQVGSSEQHHVFSYAIENYQPKREWLNSQFWANPENFDKYRW